MGVLHHSRYWEYFEMGRTELLRLAGVTYRDVEASGALLVISKCSARYMGPARYDDLLALTTTMTRMTTARIDHTYELRRVEPSPAASADGSGAAQPGELLATAETTLACIDRDGKIIPIPNVVRNAGGGMSND